MSLVDTEVARVWGSSPKGKEETPVVHEANENDPPDGDRWDFFTIRTRQRFSSTSRSDIRHSVTSDEAPWLLQPQSLEICPIFVRESPRFEAHLKMESGLKDGRPNAVSADSSSPLLR